MPRLTTVQKNKILELVLAEGLERADFYWIDEDGHAPRLVHRKTNYIFQFGDWSGGGTARYHLTWQPAYHAAQTDTYSETWPAVIHVVAKWVAAIADEHRAIDLWKTVGEAIPAPATQPFNEENTPFSDAERKAIVARLDELEHYIAETHHLPEAQRQEVAGRLDYLKGAAGRLGRIDWRNIFVGQMVAMVFDRLVPPGALHSIMQFAFQAFQALPAIFGRLLGS